MSTILSTFRQFAESLQAEGAKKPEPPAEPPAILPNSEWTPESGMSRAAFTQARYAAAFAEATTVAEASAALGMGHVACNIQLYRYEKKGLISRVGSVAEGTPVASTLWRWNANAMADDSAKGNGALRAGRTA